MAATAVVNPTSMYSNGPLPPYSGGWPSVSAASGLISPPESRRTSDNKSETPIPIHITQPQRQSLPSIHEALGPKSTPYTSPVPASLPPHNLPPYTQAPAPSITRSYPVSEHPPFTAQAALSLPKQPSPQPVHPQPNPFTRVEAPSNSLPDAPRPPPVHAPPHPGSRYEPSRYEQDSRAPERPTNGYALHPHRPYPYSGSPGHPPGPHDPAYALSRYPQRGAEEDDRSRVTPFKQGLKRRYLVWDFENYLSSINVSSNALLNWSGHFHTITQEQQPRDPNGVPDRMPTLESCNEMLQHQEKIHLYLEKMRDMISQQHEHVAMVDQHMRDHTRNSPVYYDEEMAMYSDDLKNQGYGGGPESKKRRGRAAPPGRCHSCNRAETPEWRRGPDGARTLCNACGLHYAKLTRKNTMKQSQSSNGSSLRPKSMEGISP